MKLNNQSILSICLFLLLAFPLSAKSSFAITNTFGGDRSSTTQKDFLSVNNFTNIEYTLADRLQLDASNDYFTGRIRTTITPYDVEGDYSNTNLKGFIYLHPNKYFGMAAGNSFFNKFSMDSYYFSALDEYPNFGKLLNSGLGLYGAYNFDAISNIPLTIIMSLCLDTDANYKWRELGLNFGSEILLKDYFKAGFTLKNVYDDENLTYSISISQDFIKNLIFNIGYAYNFDDFDLLLSKTKYAAFFSAGWKFSQIPLFTSLDFVSGMNDSYISDKGVTSQRGFVPFTLASKIEYEISDVLKMNLLFKLNGNIGLMEQSIYEILTSVDYKFNKKNSINAGIRVTVDSTYKNADGIIIPDVSIPLCWKFKYDD